MRPPLSTATLAVLLAVCSSLLHGAAASRGLPAMTPLPAFEELATAKGRQLLALATCKIDICFALDHSGSIRTQCPTGGDTCWEDVQDFVADVAAGVNTQSNGGARFGASLYSDRASYVSPRPTAANPNRLVTSTQITTSVNGIGSPGGSTNADGGLALCYTPPASLQAQGGGVPGATSGNDNTLSIFNTGNLEADRQRVVVHITDGQPNRYYWRTFRPIRTSPCSSSSTPAVSCIDTNNDGSTSLPSPNPATDSANQICGDVGPEADPCGKQLATSRASVIRDATNIPGQTREITLVAVGVGAGVSGANAQYLKDTSDQFFTVSDFAGLNNLVGQLVFTTCCANTVAFTGPADECYTNVVAADKVLEYRFKSTCPQPFKPNSGIRFTVAGTPTPTGSIRSASCVFTGTATPALTCTNAGSNAAQQVNCLRTAAQGDLAAGPAMGADVTCRLSINDASPLTSYSVNANLDLIGPDGQDAAGSLTNGNDAKANTFKLLPSCGTNLITDNSLAVCGCLPTCADTNAANPGTAEPFNCGPGFTLVPDPASVANPSLETCCVPLAPTTPSLALAASGDVDTCLIAQPSTSFAYTISNTGTGAANNVQFSLLISPASATGPGIWQSTTCVANSIPPSGPGTPVAFCAPPVAGAGGSQSISCGASVPPSTGTVLGAGASLTCTFTVAATGDFTTTGSIDGAVDAETGGPLDTGDIPDATLDFDKVLFSCPPTRVPDPATCSCRKLACDPCWEPNPSVFLATSRKDRALPNGIWELPTFTPSQGDATPLFRCLVTGHSTVAGRLAFNGDIAFLWDGSLLVIDTNGQIGYVPQAVFDSFPPTATPDANRLCPMTILVPAPATIPAGDGFTGMASGFDSEDYWFSTAQNLVQNLVLSEMAGSLAPVEGPQVNYTVLSDPFDPAASGGGGTDLTPGPDGNIYRWVSSSAAMNFSGTRLLYDAGAETLNGDWGYVSTGISAPDGTPYARRAFQNAGSFCTSTGVFGTAMWNDASPANTVARFFQFGVFNGVPSPAPLGLNLGFYNASAPPGATLPPALEAGGVQAPGSSQMFLVGAATKPRCV